MSVGISNLPAFSAPSLGYMRHIRYPQGTHHCVILWVLCFLGSLFFSFYSSYACFIYNIQGFEFYLVERIRKSMSTPSSWKQKSPYFFFLLVYFLFTNVMSLFSYLLNWYNIFTDRLSRIKYIPLAQNYVREME